MYILYITWYKLMQNELTAQHFAEREGYEEFYKYLTGRSAAEQSKMVSLLWTNEEPWLQVLILNASYAV